MRPLTLLILVLLFLSGCGEHRNTIVAAKMADQVLEGMQQRIATEAAITPLERDVDQLLRDLDDMLRVSRDLQGPVVSYLDAGDNVPTVTSTETVLRDWSGFKTRAATVVAEATIEAEEQTKGHQIWQQTKHYLGEIATSTLSSSLLGGGFGGLAIAAIGLLRSSRKAWAVAQAAVDYGTKVTAIAEQHSPVMVEAIQEKAEQKQRDAGVHTALKKLLPKKPVAA